MRSGRLSGAVVRRGRNVSCAFGCFAPATLSTPCPGTFRSGIRDSSRGRSVPNERLVTHEYDDPLDCESFAAAARRPLALWCAGLASRTRSTSSRQLVLLCKCDEFGIEPFLAESTHTRIPPFLPLRKKAIAKNEN